MNVDDVAGAEHIILIGQSKQLWMCMLCADWDFLKPNEAQPPISTTAALRQELKTVREEARVEIELLRKTIVEKEQESLTYRERAEKAEKSLQSVKAINKGLKHVIDTARRDDAALEAWADEPATGWQAVNLLHPEGGAVGFPRQADMLARWSAGLLRDISLAIKAHDCACKREFAANALTQNRTRFENMTPIGEGAFGLIRRAWCLKTKKEYAVKGVHEGSPADELINEMIAFSIFEADASEGLSHMHRAGVIHCDHKPQNVLICRCDGPTGFVAKVTDLGLWCGLGEMRGKKTGTGGWIPLENVLDDVLAAPAQDTFASAVNACFIMTRDDLKTKSGNMWSHTSLITPEELDRLRIVKAERRDATSVWEEIYKRVMLDGSFFSKFLKPANLNPILPPSELTHVCETLKSALSGDPMDRPEMSTFTIFLRALASYTAGRERESSPLPPGIGLPLPDAPVISSDSDVSSESTSSEGTVSLGGESAAGPDIPPPVVAAHASQPAEEGRIDDGAGAVDSVPSPAEAAVEATPSDSTMRGSAEPALHIVSPVGETSNNAAIMPTMDEIAQPVAPSMERIQLSRSPPIVAAPHTEQAEQAEEDDGGAGAGAVLLPAEAESAPSDSAMCGSGQPAVGVDPAVEQADAAEGAKNAMIIHALGEMGATPAVPLMERLHLAHPPPIANNAAVIPAPEEIIPPVAPLTEPVLLASPLPALVEPHGEQSEGGANGVDAAAAVSSPAEAAVQAATSSSTMHGPARLPVLHSPAGTGPANERAEPTVAAAVGSLQGEIGGRLDLNPNPLLLRPFPGSPAEIMATYVAGTLRTPLENLLEIGVPRHPPAVQQTHTVGHFSRRTEAPSPATTPTWPALEAGQI
eukprot:jgi/Undpi1/8981/HiC_scaffold_26.g11442.m1